MAYDLIHGQTKTDWSRGGSLRTQIGSAASFAKDQVLDELGEKGRMLLTYSAVGLGLVFVGKLAYDAIIVKKSSLHVHDDTKVRHHGA